MSPSQAMDGAVIVFDLDGTLVDTAPDLIGTLNHILAEEGLAPMDINLARPLIGHGARYLLDKGMQAQSRMADDAQLDALTSRFIEHYGRRIAHLSRPFPGVIEALSDLKAAGARLSVCTNKPTRLSVPLLEALNLAPYFASIVGADLAPAPKPDPRHLLEAITRAGGQIGRAVMVGDAAPDAGAARAAKVPLVLVSFGYTEIPASALDPDDLIDHYDQLYAACAALLDSESPAYRTIPPSKADMGGEHP